MKSKCSRTSVSVIKQVIADLDITNYERNEFGLADLFCDIYGNDIKYVPATKMYYLFNHRRMIWEVVQQEKIERLIERFLSRDCFLLVSEISDEEKRRMYRVWISKHQSNATIISILKGVRRKKKIIASLEDFDKVARYFALRNGVLDMRTNVVLPLKREHFISKYANVSYDPDCVDTTWETFLLELFDGDVAMYEYVLRMVAYAMQGEPNQHCLFMLYGPTTRNGKSTFVRGIERFFHGYGTNLGESSLAKIKSDPTSPRPDIAKLQGKRFVAVAELPKKMEMNVAFVKALTGQDTIIARKLYQNDAEEFINSAVFFLHMNRLPRITDMTLFTSHRIIVTPFDRRFDENSADVDLPRKLTSESALSGLLNDIIRVMIKYQGFSIKEKLPSRVKEATQAFVCMDDSVDRFLKNELTPKYKGWISRGELYKAYAECALRRKQKPIDAEAFSDELKDRRYTMKRHNTGWGVSGYALRDK